MNGKIFTSNVAQPYAQALAIRGERITAVGTAEQMQQLAGPITRIIDLGGRTVIPGINDAHKSSLNCAANRVDVHFKGFGPSWPEARQVLAATLETAPKGALFMVTSVRRHSTMCLLIAPPCINCPGGASRDQTSAKGKC